MALGALYPDVYIDLRSGVCPISTPLDAPDAQTAIRQGDPDTADSHDVMPRPDCQAVPHPPPRRYRQCYFCYMACLSTAAVHNPSLSLNKEIVDSRLRRSRAATWRTVLK